MLLQQKKYKFKKVMKRNLTQNNFKYNALLQFGNVGLITIRSKPISSETIETVRQAMQKKLTKLNTIFLNKKSFLKHGIKKIKNSSWRNYLGKITSFNRDGKFNITRNLFLGFVVFFIFKPLIVFNNFFHLWSILLFTSINFLRSL